MPRVINTANILAKFKRNAGAAGPALIAGVQAVTTAPTQLAAQQVNKYLANVQAAVQSGRYVASLQSVTLAEWQSSMTGKGVQNYTNGINNLSPKAQKAMADQQQFAGSVSQQIAQMPRDTDQDMENRMIANVRAMRGYKSGA